jgi:Family of unknown function (DUF6090)
MIKFFRHIRKRLVAESPPERRSRAGKYLLYAIGEIVLVVSGILIALQINNWNSNRVQNKKEAIYMANIKRDLNEQLKTIDSQIEYERNINKIATPIIMNYKANQSFEVDSLFTVSIGILTGRRTFVKNTPTYTELISSGNIDIISNSVIKDEIIKYYQELERVELVINKNNNLYTDAVFIPGMMGLSEIQIKGEFKTEELRSFIQNDPIPLLDLNETALKDITKAQLKDPENILKFMNSINFRNFGAKLHLYLMKSQKKNTQELLQKVASEY